jgi:hypothetical protein
MRRIAEVGGGGMEVQRGDGGGGWRWVRITVLPVAGYMSMRGIDKLCVAVKQ